MTLIDTGPLVALLDAVDPYHSVCVAAATTLPPVPLATTWPCFTEAMYLLRRAGGYRYQKQLWSLRSTGRLVLLDLDEAVIDRISDLMNRYRNLPMDIADASLVAVAETLRLKQLFTVDQDFRVYQLSDGTFLNLVP